MLPLVPLAVSLAPALAKWLFGDAAGATARTVADIVRQVTGTDDPTAARAAVSSNPDLATALTVQLSQIAAAREAEADAARQAELVAVVSDIASARNQTVTLDAAKSPLAWGAAIISAVVLATFGAMLVCLMTMDIPQSALPLANVMLGTLAAMATSVVGYWVGSSAGSARKSDVIAEQSRSLAVSTPPSAG